MSDPLAHFHPLVRTWFRENLGTPTDIQIQAWPPIAAGKHVLLTAPTGSGKTLTAFLSALDRLVSGAWPPGRTRILYVSPLKALNNDVQRNLLAPLEAIGGYFRRAGEAFPEIRVQVRSGDTPATERRRMLKHPPEILITTPESLNLMLLSEAGRDALRDIAVVILDEIHAVAGTKRGVHLITAVDRLVPLAGEFQRIALSATVRPLEAVASLVGGYILGRTGYVPRPVTTVVSRSPKRYELQVRYPVESMAGMPGSLLPGDGRDIWGAIAAEIKRLIAGARSTLIFTNNRRLAERLARLLNDGEPAPIAYAHHGSLSREIRAVVESRMKEGRLPAIVATNSLELGIDIGALDQVILVQTPFSVASALQRIGRAGHGVGQVSRGLLFASHGRDALDAAVAVKCILAADIEEVRLVEGPLDLLAQILVSLAASGEWTLDRLYAFIRTSHPYRNLPRNHFDLVAEMLAGRFEETRIRELRPRLSIDAVDGSVRATKGSALALALGGGTIPDRGYYALRHADTRAKIGELDEEFVWERRAGEIFALGSQSWKISRITANDVEVTPAGRDAQMAPFWRAEERDRGFHLSNRLGEFLEQAGDRLDDPDFLRGLREDCRLDEATAAAVLSFLRRQREATRSALPHRRHLLVEDAGQAPGSGASPPASSGEGNRQVILHSIWGGRLNRPWAYALAAAYEKRTGRALEIIPGDDCLLVQLPPEETPMGILEWVHADNLEALLRLRLEETGYFVGHFRENAARALLLPRSTLRARVPLWLSRIRSQNLLAAVSGFADFPIVLETWRECLRDEFDLPALKAMLDELHGGAIRVSECRTLEPSPFAEGLIWKQTNQLMYQGNRPPGVAAGPREDLLREIAFSSPLRPRIPREVIRDFEAKAQRTAPGYAPQDALELVEWVKERLLIPRDEWLRLLLLCGASEDPAAQAEHARYLGSRLVGIRLPEADPGAGAAISAIEALPRIWEDLGMAPEDAVLSHPLPAVDGSARPATPEALESLARLIRSRTRPDPDGEGGEGNGAAPLLSQWLRSYGPVTPEFLRGLFGASFPKVEEALEELAEGDRIVSDTLSEDAAGAEVCDAENLELLLRLMRRRSRPSFQTLPAERLPLFLASWQGLTDPSRDLEGAQAALEKLFGYPAPAAAWESEFLPARVVPYRTGLLDELFRDSDLIWFGCGREKTAFAFPEDLELFLPSGEAGDGNGRGDGGGGDGADAAKTRPPSPLDQVLHILASAAPARLDYQALTARCPLPSDKLVESLWELAWRGRITNDTYAALRKGMETGFKFSLPDSGSARGEVPQRAGGPSRRGRFQRWKAARPLSGAWGVLDAGGNGEETGPLEREELAKDRVRQLLRRYGLLFRGLLEHELPALQWSALFRALRLLELSGEVLSGHFFSGIPGLQFISPPALRVLEAKLPDDAVFWMSATDPASPCALGLEGLPYGLPPRLASTHLVFHGAELALISRRLGHDLSIRVPPGHTYLASYLSALRNLVDRAFLPLKNVEVETVNGEPSMDSPYLRDLMEAGFEKGIKTVSLRKRY